MGATVKQNRKRKAADEVCDKKKEEDNIEVVDVIEERRTEVGELSR